MKTTLPPGAAEVATGCATITGAVLTARIAPDETATEVVPPTVLVTMQS